MISPTPKALVKRSKRNGFGYHFGVVRSDSTVFESSVDTGPRIASFRDFAMNRTVTTVALLTRQAARRASLRLERELQHPQRYDFFTNNCEIAANRVVGREPRSRQVEGLYFVATLAFILVALK